VRRVIDEQRLPVEIEIDGGISEQTAPLAAEAGVDVLVAGSAIFGADDPLTAARRIRAAAWPTAA
jgi:ribulose-phosphate 3-epimerase